MTPNSEANSFCYRNGGNGDAGAFFHVVFDHLADIHAVNMVGAENDHHMRVRLLNRD